MSLARVLILLAFLSVLAAPYFVRRSVESARAQASGGPAARPGDPAAEVRTLIIVTPHVEQIRGEFGRAFAAWHERRTGQQAHVDFRTPGGTTEIRKQLENQVRAILERAGGGDAGKTFDILPASTLKAPDRDKEVIPEAVIRPGGVEADLFFGGGSFEHGQVKTGLILELTIDGRKQRVRARITAPVGRAPAVATLKPEPGPPAFSPEFLQATYGDNVIGIEQLYDPDGYWMGSALSGFGIVFNRDVLRRLGLPDPTSFADIGDPRYTGLVALADARQSGSVATLYDAILNKEGWDRGWRTLREMAANARYFAASSTTPPTDVSQGEAAAGVAIDFYGRGQAQAIVRKGEDPLTSRVGYVDPPGATYIDADPISIVNGARSPDLARSFVEFCLTDEAQALWQFAPATDPAFGANPRGPTGEPMGPAASRLRRMPVKRSFYDRFGAALTDKTNPFQIASSFKRRGWRDAIGPLMGAFGVDTGEELRAAWRALNRARGNTAFPPDRLAEMERLFYAMPEHTLVDKDGKATTLTLSEAAYKAISDDTNRWRDPVKGPRARIAYTRFFIENYRRVVELGEQAP